VVLAMRNAGIEDLALTGVRVVFATVPLSSEDRAQMLPNSQPQFVFDGELAFASGEELTLPVTFRFSEVVAPYKSVRVFFNVVFRDAEGGVYRNTVFMKDYAPVKEDELITDVVDAVTVAATLSAVAAAYVMRERIMNGYGLFVKEAPARRRE